MGAQIVSLVEQILCQRNLNYQADCSELENAIDQLVYQIYGITDEQILMIEEADNNGKR